MVGVPPPRGRFDSVLFLDPPPVMIGRGPMAVQSGVEAWRRSCAAQGRYWTGNGRRISVASYVAPSGRSSSTVVRPST